MNENYDINVSLRRFDIMKISQLINSNLLPIAQRCNIDYFVGNNITQILTKSENIDLNKNSILTIQQQQEKPNEKILLHIQKTILTYQMNKLSKVATYIKHLKKKWQEQLSKEIQMN